MGELVHERLERNAVLERQADRRREGIHQARDRRALLRHAQEDLARLPVVEEADRHVTLVAGNVELVRDAAALVGELAAEWRPRGSRRRNRLADVLERRALLRRPAVRPGRG